MRKVMAALLLLLGTGLVSASAESKVELREMTAGTYAVANGLPVPIVALVVARDPHGQLMAATSVSVGARSVTSAERVRGPIVRIEDWDVIDLRVPRWNLPAVSGRGQSLLTPADPTQTRDLLKQLEISESGDGAAKIALAAEEARLWLEQRNDEKDTFRHDPLRFEMERQTVGLNNIQIIQRENQRMVDQALEDVTDMALAYRRAADASLEVLSRERDIYEPYYKDAKLRLALLKQDRERATAETQAGGAFLATAHAALAALPREGLDASPISVSRGPRRLDDAPSRLKDLVEIRGAAPQFLNVLLAEARFDRGGTQKTFFRRIGKSDQWIAMIYWPLPAAEARFELELPGQGQRRRLDAAVKPGRPSMASSYQLAEQSMNIVIKKYKESSFRAQGADEIKTIPIP